MSYLRRIQAQVPHWVDPDEEDGHVVRIQNSAGRGPFDEKTRAKWVEKDGHVSPFEDDFDSRIFDMISEAQDENQGQLLYGFRDQAQLKKYFTVGELKKMKELGYTAHTVKADYVWYGKHQVIFQPKGWSGF